jgi:hypothetical protein
VLWTNEKCVSFGRSQHTDSSVVQPLAQVIFRLHSSVPVPDSALCISLMTSRDNVEVFVNSVFKRVRKISKSDC